MRALGPEFIDITWYGTSPVLVMKPPHVFFFFHRNAGGRTSDLTSEMVKTCQGLIGIETCMHLTCTNMRKEKVDIALTVGSFPKITHNSIN
jgi:methylenetetrahydrofolate reductase (NADPH)